MDTYKISEDITAFLERDGADYTGNLVIRSDSLDDYDTHRIGADGLWELEYDSLSNKHPFAWSNEPGFQNWIQKMKHLILRA